MSITKFLARSIADYDSQNSMGSRLRAKRIGPLLQLIDAAYKEHGCVKIVDIGGTERYWGIVSPQYLKERNVSITIVNIPGEKLPASHGSFTFIHADGCDLKEFADGEFHIAHSNSVIEHVGDWGRMIQFAKEFKRVASRYFIQTPNYWFPIEPHCMTPFFHWLPKPMRVWLVSKRSLGNWAKAQSISDAVQIVESARLLNFKMFRELFDDSRIVTERLAFMPKSFVAIKD